MNACPRWSSLAAQCKSLWNRYTFAAANFGADTSYCPHSKVSQDSEFALYTVTIFRRVRNEFAQKCRDEKFVVREFVYNEAAVEKQNEELAELEASEKELWVSFPVSAPPWSFAISHTVTDN